MALLDRIKRLFSRQRKSLPEDLPAVPRPGSSQMPLRPSSDTTLMGARSRAFKQQVPFQSLLPYLIALLIGMMAADYTALSLRPLMIPANLPPARRAAPSQDMQMANIRSDYNEITKRNIFNSDGIIPENLIAKNEDKAADQNVAVESQLPITLLGTIVHVNPGKSVATLEAKNSQAGALPYVPNDDISGLATLIKVERKKVFIRNLSNNRYEYVQIKDDPGVTLTKAKGVAQSPAPGIKKEGETNFAVERSKLEGLMNNLPDLLTQARAIPNMVGGKVDGFKIVEIQPGSIFEKLGIKMNDVIKQVDGEPVDSPAKAMELYNALRTKNNVNITVDRGGSATTLNYNIH